MATGTHRFGAGRSQLRRVVAQYVGLIGPGGLTSYVVPQDLLIITDFNSLLVLREAHRYVAAHKLRAVAEFAGERRELPGAHILDSAEHCLPTDIRYKSGVCDKSIYVMDLIALSDAQEKVDLEYRYPLQKRFKTRHDTEPTTTVSHYRGVEIDVGDKYFNALMSPEEVQLYSGVHNPHKEPTRAWQDVPVSDKGVFFRANETFYGLVMPHAKTNVSSRDGGD